MNDDPLASRFDETAYLHANPDVRLAVGPNGFRSGRHHWDAHGRAEGRPLASLHPPLPRREKLLGRGGEAGTITPSTMTGLEIGALTNPIVTKAESAGKILYVDHADTQTLRRKYPATEIAHHDLVDVDLVWGERTLAESLGPGRTVDYVVNAHVIEHVPDLVTWLAEIHAVLEPTGQLRMAIPDRRFTFDLPRRNATLADALAAAIDRPRRPTPRQVLDHFLNVAAVDRVQAWRGEIDPDALTPDHTKADAQIKAERVAQTDFYQDTHCWVFTPLSFATICAGLAELGHLPFACADLYPTEYLDLEFFVAMRPARDPADAIDTWRTMTRRLREIGPLSAPLAHH